MPKIISVEKMIAVEQAQVKLGTTLDALMRQAGVGLAQAVADHSNASLNSKKVVALVGSGNNGGDALVAIVKLANAGWNCAVAIIGRRKLDDPLVTEAIAAGCKFHNQDDDLLALLEDSPVVIDGILGTGFKLPMRDDLAQTMENIGRSIRSLGCEVFAVDCPSGVECDSGALSEHVIPADVTVCMAAVKQGLLKFPAAEIVGRLMTVAIGITENNPEWQLATDEVLDAKTLLELLPSRNPNSHKGSFGKVLICGGCIEYPGASVLSAMGAYSVGAGLVRVAAIDRIQLAFAGQIPEVVWARLVDQDGFLCKASLPAFESAIIGQNALVLGPGLGQAEQVSEFMKLAIQVLAMKPIRDFGTRCVIDADGLRHLAQQEYWHENLPPNSIITPHPGEFASINLGLDLSDNERVNNAKTAAQAWNCVVVLKGAMTVVAAPDGRIVVIPIATSALAKAGTGDVLAGMIAGWMAQGLGSFNAAVVGAALHGLAGLAASQDLKSDRSVMASDLRYYIGDVISNLPEQLNKPGLLGI